jgi:uncharacterized lipoprotein YmbA
MRAGKWMLYLSIVALITACGSTPRSNYYMLSAEAAGATGKSGPALGIGPVTVPEYLQRREMVLNRSANKLELADFDRWAEPLDAGILRVTALNLAALLQTQQVRVFPWRRSYQPDYGISIAVVQFAMRDATAELVAEWTITVPASGVSITQKISRLEAQARDAEPESVAAAYSKLLAQLSEEIATVIRQQQGQ